MNNLDSIVTSRPKQKSRLRENSRYRISRSAMHAAGKFIHRLGRASFRQALGFQRLCQRDQIVYLEVDRAGSEVLQDLYALFRSLCSIAHGAVEALDV